MTTLANWVEPLAARYAETRREIAHTARVVPSDAWETPSPVPGWSYKDVFAHLAEGDVSLRHTIQVVVDGGDTDFREWNNGREERIAGGLERGAALTVEELIAKVLADGDETQRLFARVKDEHEAVQVITSRTDPTPHGLGEHLASYHHDEEHLEHLRPALTAGSVVR